MDGSLKLGDILESQYARMLLRVEQREDHLRITVYDSHSVHSDTPVWSGETHDIEEAKDTAFRVAQGYLADATDPTPVWNKGS